MGKIYYILGKSASGKDAIYHRLMANPTLNLKTVTMVTTRPRRANETDSEEYHFIDSGTLEAYRKDGTLIESRTYDTVHGPWSYGLVDDGNIDLQKDNYLIVGVLESYISVRDYFTPDAVCPIYVYVEDGERLIRAINRERRQENPCYGEICRRFLADDMDFSKEKLDAAGIVRRFENRRLDTCVREIIEYIKNDMRYHIESGK